MLTKLAGALAGIVMFAVIGFGLWLGWQALTAHQRQAQGAANVAVVAGTTKTQTVIGHDAVATVQAQGESEAAIHAQTQASTKAITAAPGAEAPVQPALYNVALREHCRRASARGRPECAVFRIKGS
jgi:hypothetical protein